MVGRRPPSRTTPTTRPRTGRGETDRDRQTAAREQHANVTYCTRYPDMGNVISIALVLNGLLDVGFLVPALRSHLTREWFRTAGPANSVHGSLLGWSFALHGICRLSAGLEMGNSALRRIAMFSYAVELSAFGTQVAQGKLPFKPVSPTIDIPAIMLCALTAQL